MFTQSYTTTLYYNYAFLVLGLLALSYLINKLIDARSRWLSVWWLNNATTINSLHNITTNRNLSKAKKKRLIETFALKMPSPLALFFTRKPFDLLDYFSKKEVEYFTDNTTDFNNRKKAASPINGSTKFNTPAENHINNMRRPIKEAFLSPIPSPEPKAIKPVSKMCYPACNEPIKTLFV